jgi:hypothetical protein
LSTEQYDEDRRGREPLTATTISISTTAIGLEFDFGATGWGVDLRRVLSEAPAMIIAVLTKVRADNDAGERRRLSPGAAKVPDELPDWRPGRIIHRELERRFDIIPTDLQEQIGVEQGTTREPLIIWGIFLTVVWLIGIAAKCDSLVSSELG